MRTVLLFLILLLVGEVFAQKTDVDKYIQSQRHENTFTKSKKYRGPSNSSSVYSSNIKDNDFLKDEEETSNSPLNIYIEEDDLEDSRYEKYGDDYDANKKIPNAKVLPPDPVELPDIRLPDVDLPDIDLPDVNLPNIDPIGTWEMWRMLLIILLLVALAFGIYLLVRHYQPGDSKVKVYTDDEWNPTIVTKSELELKLEKAEFTSNYRECVRIHFMFILKELIEHNLITWQLEKTNYDYLNEVRKNKGLDDFEACVRIYDLVWYGDYAITKENYLSLKPILENYYQTFRDKA